ncbi:hypothetical protein BDQ17DRAFT_1425395 [Cyathus striatus]|nr:hypothetical protein BDQ17DRAFT_1425395 [Cyathus striatus]
MPKAHGKSSATSATRKKHAKKTAGTPQQDPINTKQNKEKKEKSKGKKKNEPRVKMYIPPVKPAPPLPDPLETTGLARTLPPELVIVLRNLSKKAQVTKLRALDELLAQWIEKCKAERKEENDIVYTVVEMLPVWVSPSHLFAYNWCSSLPLLAASFTILTCSSVTTHPFLAATIHAALFAIPQTRSSLVFTLSESMSSAQLESILGTWCIASHDVDRAVANVAVGTWKEVVFTALVQGTGLKSNVILLDDKCLGILISFIQKTVLDPVGVYSSLNPPSLAVPPPPPQSRKSGRNAPPPQPRDRGDDGDQSSRTKAEEFEENEADRKARLRVGALGALRLVIQITKEPRSEVLALLGSPFLWSSLHVAQACPFLRGAEDAQSFGYAQPLVRRAAWGLLQAVVTSYKDGVDKVVHTLSTAVLRSAWVESDSTVHAVMWQPLLIFLKECPDSWEIDRAFSSRKFHDEEREEEEEEEEDDDDDTGDDEIEDKPKEKHAVPELTEQPSYAYQEFLQFLQLGCSGSPVQGYPAVMVILSTIPSSIFAFSQSQDPPLTELFTSFWAAVDGRALSSLQRSATSAAFLGSLLECLSLLVRRLYRPSDVVKEKVNSLLNSTLTPDAEAKRLVYEQFSLVWESLSSGRLKVEERAASRLIAHALDSLYDISPALFKAGWEGLQRHLIRTEHPSLVATLLKVLYDRFKEGSQVKDAVKKSLQELLSQEIVDTERAMTRLEDEGIIPPQEPFALLQTLLETFREGLFFDDTFTERLDEVLVEKAYLISKYFPSLLLAYLTYRNSSSHTITLWHTLLAGFGTKPEEIHKTIAPFIVAAKKGCLPIHLKPASDELDDLSGRLLAGTADDLELVSNIMTTADYFLSKRGFFALLESIISAFDIQVDLVIGGNSEPLFGFASSLNLLTAVCSNPPTHLTSPGCFNTLLPHLFIFAYLFPELGVGNHPSFLTAQKLWLVFLEKDVQWKNKIIDSVKIYLKSLVGDTQVRPTPEHIIYMLSKNPPGPRINVLEQIFPSRAELDKMLVNLPPHAIDPSLGVIDALLPPVFVGYTNQPSPVCDSRGFSAYARIVAALLHMFLEDRRLAKQNLWTLRHFVALSQFAIDFQSVPTGRSPVFAPMTLNSTLSELILKSNQITTYLLFSSSDNSWRTNALQSASMQMQKDAHKLDDLGRFLVDAISFATSNDTVRDARILGVVLGHVIKDIDATEADAWVMFARTLERNAPQTSMTIINAVVGTEINTPRLDRYRNELAAGLLGIPASRANKDGLRTLRELVATAPRSESEVVFLPQVRAVNTIKACQEWVSSDEDIDEELESVMTLVFVHLVPILQNVPGAHWDFIFDLLESNLEGSSIQEDSNLVILSRSLKLILTIQDICSTNKSLRANWRERETTILMAVRELASAKLGNVGVSLPRSICRELLLDIVQDIPASLVDHETFSKMCHLIVDPSPSVQKMAYKLLQSAAQKRTEYIVIEAGVDSESPINVELPRELLDIIQHDINFNLADEDEQIIFGYLLGWTLLFDLFKNASFKVRSGYIEQLRNSDIVIAHFVPCFIGLLHLDEGLTKSFKLDIWAVDEFYIELFEPGTDFSIPLFAAHLYYRALLTIPSLIHTWLLDCKDRQLSSTVTAYTSQHFSPVIIRAELAYVKDPETLKDLVDDNMTVKVATAVNEVTASYLVDEHQLEIKLKIPSDWPLHRIEVKDVKRVGVDESRWRAWILAVQQTIWSHNGRISDGLGLFKKNVTLHFEGQVECAICYSYVASFSLVVDVYLAKRMHAESSALWTAVFLANLVGRVKTGSTQLVCTR